MPSLIKTPDSELARAMARDWLTNYVAAFATSIRRERSTAQTASAAMVDALASVAALAIAGGHGSKEEIVEATVTSLRNSIDRDLAHLSGDVRPA